jgi:hypothetical protein
MGGGGHFGIRLDADMCTGSSGWCATFNSPCLSAAEDFECVNAEWWGFSGGFAEDVAHSPPASSALQARSDLLLGRRSLGS